MRNDATTDQRAWSSNRQLFSLLVGPITYIVYFIAVYLLAEAACRMGILMAPVLGIPLLLGLVVVVGLPVLALIGYGGGLAYRAWRARPDAGPAVEDRDAFMALAALTLTVLFGLATVLTALSVIVTNPCRWT